MTYAIQGGRDPFDIDTLTRLADSEMQQGRFDSAARLCERVLSVRPGDGRAWHRHAMAMLELGDPQRALASVDRALQLVPTSADVLQDKALALARLFRRDEALQCFEESIRYRPVTERDFHRLSLLVELGRDDEVVELAGQLAAVHPHRTDLQVTLAWGQIWLGRVVQGLSTFDRLVARCSADDIAPRMHAAYANLLTGRFERGWDLHESRIAGARPLVRGPRRAPEWRGEVPLAGRSLLIYAEQGIGDSLQFCRYLPMLDALGAQVTIEAPQVLHELLRSLAPAPTIAEPGSIARADLQCPLLSLPFALSTRLDTIPAAIPYLKAPEHRVATWRKRLGLAKAMRVGLACSGNPRHGSDRRRSMPLELVAPWVRLNCEFHLLQSELRASDEAFLRESGIRDHRNELTDLTETAALACCMDLVICVDTSVAHLAGALGVPVWVMLAKPSDWRWLLDRDDSPWYSTARLFRMSDRGQWRGVIEDVATALAEQSHGLC